MSAIFFVISFFVLYFSILFYKKEEKKLNFFTCCAMTFIFVFFVHAFVAGIINLVKIHINTWSIGVVDLALGVGIWMKIIKDKIRQTFYVEPIDLISTLIFLSVTIFVGIQQFGKSLNIAYESVDGGTHFRMALEVLKNQNVSSMYFAPLNNALFLEIFKPFCKITQLYHFYILADLFMFFLGGYAFWCVIRQKATTKGKQILAIIITLIYMLGYPRNSLLYGFNYFGISIIIILFLMWAFQLYVNEEISEIVFILCMNMGCLSLGLCYSLFVPVVYVSLALTLFRYLWHLNGNIFKIEWIKKAIILNFKVFLIPTIIVLYYSFFGFFGNTNPSSGVASGISMEGGIYRDLFSNFVFWLPFAVYAALMIFFEKKDDLAIMYAIFLGIFMLYLAIKVMKGETSTYYYYKNNFFLSAVIFYLAYYALIMLMDLKWQIVFSYFLIYFLLMISTVFHVEERMQQKSFLLVPIVKSNYYFDIYETDHLLLSQVNQFNDEKVEISEYCYTNYPQQNNPSITFFGNSVDYNIFRGITMRLEGDATGFVNCTTSEESDVTVYDIFEQGYQRLCEEKNKTVEQPLVFMSSDEKLKTDIKNQYKDKINIVFENTEGFVAVLK